MVRCAPWKESLLLFKMLFCLSEIYRFNPFQILLFAQLLIEKTVLLSAKPNATVAIGTSVTVITKIALRDIGAILTEA